ncbi:MAG: hypothetical protein L0323_11235 [Planctomycetes bacterium]|nr:hypothetical protein [Planctomycetota bacterium]
MKASLALLGALGLPLLSPRAGGQTTIFSESFEGGGIGAYTETDSDGVGAPTLWHGGASCTATTPLPSSMGTNAAAYNQGDVGVFNYNTGQNPNEGAIESPVHASGSGASLSVSFLHVKVTEGGGLGGFDVCTLEARPAGSPCWSVVTALSGNAPCSGSATSTSTIPWIAGGAWQHRFHFDSIDAGSNNFLGWIVDNVVVTETAAAPVFATTLFAEDFETPGTGGLGSMVETNASGNPATTLWHGEGSCEPNFAIPSCLGTAAAAYNQGDLGVYDYATGNSSNAGAIETPVIAVPPFASGVRVLLDDMKATDWGGDFPPSGAFDQCFVEARPTGAPGWTTVIQVLPDVPSCLAPRTLVVGPAPSLSAFPAAGGGRVRFRFDSVDDEFNDYFGWYVDNVRVEALLPGGTLPFGAGCPGTGALVPAIGASGLPQLGNGAFAVTLSDALPGASATLVVGVSDSSWLGASLPASLSSLGLGTSCSLLVSVDVVVSATVDAAGTATVGIPLPSAAGFAGASAFAQWGVLDPGTGTSQPVAMSNGLRITLF